MRRRSEYFFAVPSSNFLDDSEEACYHGAYVRLHTSISGIRLHNIPLPHSEHVAVGKIRTTMALKDNVVHNIAHHLAWDCNLLVLLQPTNNAKSDEKWYWP